MIVLVAIVLYCYSGWVSDCVFLVTDELLAEKEKYKNISDELDQTNAELAGM